MTIPRDKLFCIDFSSSPGVIIINNPSVLTSVVSLWFRAGSRYAPEGKVGLPHLFEHLFLPCTSSYKLKSDFFIATEKLGLYEGATTYPDLVEYHFHCLPGQEDLALRKLIECYQSHEITGDQLQKEKNIINEERKRSRNNPTIYANKLSNQALWPNSSLAKDTFGNEANIDSITITDLKNFEQQYYGSENMTVVILSPIEPNKDKIQKILLPLRSDRKIIFRPETVNPVQKRLHEERDLESLQVNLSYRFGGLTQKEEIIMLFIKHLLTFGWTSKLMQLNQREGLTYNFQGDFQDYMDVSKLSIYFSIDKSKLGSTVAMVKEEINKLRSVELSDEELLNSKNMFTLLNHMSASNKSFWLPMYGHEAMKRKSSMTLYGDYVDHVLKIKASEICEVAQRFLVESESALTTIGKL